MEQWELDADADIDADADDAMDEFLDKFQNQSYSGGFHEDQWEEEFEKVPLFMKKAPSEIDPNENPDLACLQSIIFDEERSPEEQAKTYKNEGNDYFKEKEYKKAVISYSEGLKKKCTDPDLNVVLYTNRAAAQFYLGNFRSALNDVTAARKLKPCHLKAIVRGALCHLELRNFAEAVNWCDEGLQIDSKEKKLLEMRAKADKLKRIEQRNIRKAKLKEKKEQNQNKILFQAIKARNIKLVSEATSEDEDSDLEDLGELFLDRISSENRYGARLSVDARGRLSWPVLFLYPEHTQSDFIAAFHEDTRFIDHLMVMFGEIPSWDLEEKYCPANIQIYFEDDGGTELYRVPPESTLLQVLQHPRYFVKALIPAFLLCVGASSFCKNYLRGKKLHEIKW
ncbi:tetratricopeptide repeat protein 4 [Hyaena hyaena]|uniref:tetratricopeptide repeat protein 4 n=1 Tax=Hyaena hyaena TaxID=95912 RepID=UPI001924761F|nr:tetratricopeptide repeat protein 4 [Hyaena hyaena]